MRIRTAVLLIAAIVGCVALAAASAGAQPRPVATEVYQVAPGDTLWSLARRFGTTPDRLASMNGISPDGILSIGQRLKIPAPSGQPALPAEDEAADVAGPSQAAILKRAAPPSPRLAAAVSAYRVQAGDTLWSISRRSGTTPDRLAAMNGISRDTILNIGRELKVPARAGGVSTAMPGAAPRARLAALPSRGERWASGLVALSTRQMGVRYRWGGTTPSGFDCSGFLYYVFGQMGVTLPRTTYAMYDAVTPVPRDELQTGDIVFFQTISPGPSHAGVYLGNGRFIHSSSGTGHVTITTMDDDYYAPRYLGARRF